MALSAWCKLKLASPAEAGAAFQRQVIPRCPGGPAAARPSSANFWAAKVDMSALRKAGGVVVGPEGGPGGRLAR